MTESNHVLLFKGSKALEFYLADALAGDPGIGDAKCTSGLLEPGSDEWWLALVGRLPDPGQALDGHVRFYAHGSVDHEAGTLSFSANGRGSASGTLRLSRSASDGTLVETVPLRPWSRREQADAEAALVVPSEDLGGHLAAFMALGLDPAAISVSALADDGRVLIDVGKGAWSAVEDARAWERAHGLRLGDAVSAYRRLPGRRRVLVAWGLAHPLEASLSEPKAKNSLLLVGTDGHRTARMGPSETLASITERAVASVQVAASGLGEDAPAEPFAAEVALEPAFESRDPELWAIPASAVGELESLLARIPEDELKNLIFAETDGPDGRLLLVREIIAARRSARLLPLSGRTWAPEPGLGNLLLPSGLRLSPRLRPEVASKAFLLKPGEITLLDLGSDGAIRALKVDEMHFRPVEDLAEFCHGGGTKAARRLAMADPWAAQAFAQDAPIIERERERRRRDPLPERQPVPERIERDSDDDAAAERPEPAKAQKRPAREKPEQQERRQDGRALADVEREAAELQRRLTDDPDDAASWLRLAEARFAQRDEEEGFRALENAMWYGDTEARSAARAAIVERASAGKGETARLWSQAAAFADQAQDLPPAKLRTETTAAYAALKAREEALRKKTRWLLWSEVAGAAGDDIEAERQREDMLAELALKGVEDREVPSFVRQRLLEQYSSSTPASGGRPTEALEFLKTAEQFAASAGSPWHVAASTAHVAWAYAELGSIDKARELARIAERSVDQADPRQGQTSISRTAALARIGCVSERVDGPEAGRAALRRALDAAADGHGGGRQAQAVEQRKALVRWFRIVAAAGQTQEVAKAAVAGLEKVSALPDHVQATLLEEAAAAILVLGHADKGREMARKLLQKQDLALMYHEHAAGALDVFEEGRVRAQDGATIMATVRKKPSELDEFAPDMLIVALRTEQDPWRHAERLAKDIEKENPYGSLIVRLAGLRCLAEQKDRERGQRLLAETLEAAKAHRGDGGGLERMRMVVRILHLVPAFAMRERGVALLRETKDWAKKENSLYARNEILGACVMAASKLGIPRETVRLLEEIVDNVLQLIEKPEGNKQVSYLFEALDAAATGAAEIGEPERGLGVIAKVASAATAAIGRYEASKRQGERAIVDGAGRFFYYRALIRCGAAAVQLGDRDAALRYFETALEKIGDTTGCDRSDLLNQAAHASNQLEGAARYALASKVLDLARGCLDGTEANRQFVVDLAERISSDVVRGESAFAAALMRWKGDEERRIRERITERPAVRGK